MGTCYAHQKPHYIMEGSNHDKCSMLSIFNTVLALLDQYERHEINGFEVAYNNDGLYFDAQLGPNQWLYYFEPLKVMHEEPHITMRVTNYFKFIQGTLALFEMPRERKEYLIRTYIHLNQEMQERIANFTKYELQDAYVIGISYTKYDNIPAHLKITYEQMSATIQDTINTLPKGEPYKLFVNSNSKAFMSYARQKFNDVTIVTCKQKGDNDIHTWLANIFILAQTKCIISNGSIMSKMAAGCNSQIPLIELAPHWAEYDQLSSSKKLFKLLRYPFKLINLVSRDVLLNKDGII